MNLYPGKPPVYVCDPSKRNDCNKTECYINGGECCMTTDESCKCTDIDDHTVEVINRYFSNGGRALPGIIRSIVKQKGKNS